MTASTPLLGWAAAVVSLAMAARAVVQHIGETGEPVARPGRTWDADEIADAMHYAGLNIGAAGVRRPE